MMQSPVDELPAKTNTRARWREHEIILVTIITAVLVAGYFRDMFMLDPRKLEATFIIPYHEHDLAFNYYRNVLFPKIGTVLLLYACYLCINRMIVPLLKKLSFKEEPAKIFQKIIIVIFGFLLLSYLLALGVNVATYYAHPHYFNYSGFQFLALFGYNDHPLKDLWQGFDRAVVSVAIFTLLACMREVIIYLVERPGNRRSYRVLIMNQLTTFAIIYLSIFSVLVAFDLFHGHILRLIYGSFIPPVFLVFMANTYWLFPFKGEMPFYHYKVIVRLLLCTFLCALPFSTINDIRLPDKMFVFLMACWAMQLFVTTPVSWLIYQQRKDKILQLRGLQKQLVKSKADLQFLRSQINPHFLFNALNTLYGTALREKATNSAEGIQKLGDMMRFMLHENNLDFIPMNREISYLENYISLQKLRTQASAEVIIEDNIGTQPCNHLVAPMILIPFIENAFKHGISLEEKSWIHISLACEEKYIRLEVRNSIHNSLSNDPEKENSGIGLKNVLERLKLVYPGKHDISINAGNREFIVRLSIQP